jgi:hypothetical protein
MSRYTGPRLRVMRALGVELPGLSTRKMERLSVNRAAATAQIIGMPDEGSVPFPIELRLVVEFYSR